MRFFVYQDTRGEYRWHLKSANGRIIADSGEGYQNRTDCLTMIRHIKQSVSTATIQ